MTRYHGEFSNAPLKRIFAWILWPTIYSGGLALTSFALASSHPMLGFNLVYFSIIFLILAFEKWMPFEKKWQEADGETLNNIGHTLLTKGAVQLFAAALLSLNFSTLTLFLSNAPHGGVWPHAWPMWLQVVLAVIVAELGLYIAHRLAHEWPYLWRFHALHHSVTRLWVINTGRFHLIDSLLKIILSQIPLFFLGAPLQVFLWFSAITAFTGLLTHCNIYMRTGWLNYIFTTPELHRWHHSKVLAEGNKNYGENTVIWDLVFGTYFNAERRPPVEIGIPGRIAKRFFDQLIQPFSDKGKKEIFGE